VLGNREATAATESCCLSDKGQVRTSGTAKMMCDSLNLDVLLHLQIHCWMESIMGSLLPLALAAVAVVLAACLAAMVYVMSSIGFVFDTTQEASVRGKHWRCSRRGPNRHTGCASYPEDHSWATMLSKQVCSLAQHTSMYHQNSILACKCCFGT
jgi:hypothetical protein